MLAAILALCTAASPDGHQRMVDALADIVARAPDENYWLGDAAAREKRREFENLPDDARDEDVWRISLELGLLELRLGREQEAIEHLDRAYGLLPALADRMPPPLATTTIFKVATGYLRLGETQNCCLRNAPESCIIPIHGAGLHVDETGSRRAMALLIEVLERERSDMVMYCRAMWLLNLAAMTVGEYPQGVPERYLIPPEAFASDEAFPRFENIAPRLGVNSFNLFGSAVIDDLDGDEYLDIFTTTFDPRDRIHLFRNNRDGTFTDVAVDANLAELYGGINTVQADYDNDGDTDLYVLRGAWMADAGRHPNSLIRNNGDGTFTDVTFDAGLGEVHYPTQTAAWADYDNDGDVDLYVGNEHARRITNVIGNDLARGVRAPCQLFLNNGDGTFTDVAAAAGVENFRFVKGVVWGDYDGDRLPDLYTSCLGAPNRLYHNNGNGTFTDVAPRLGVTKPRDSFPVWFWDFDNDGVLDLYVPSYKGVVGSIAGVAASYMDFESNMEMPCLYRGDGHGGFEEVARERGLTRFLLPMGANFGDLDGDGWLDFYLGTGYPAYEALAPNVMYHNVGGEHFADVTWAGGFGNLQKGHSVAFADLDNDGDQDVFEQMGGILAGDRFSDALYENPGFGNHWITIRLVGVRSNRSAIGARIRIDVTEDGHTRSIFRHVNSGGSFGANPLRQTIGLGRAATIDRLEVYWPTTQETQTFEDVAADRCVRITEGSGLETVPLDRLTLKGAG